MTYFARALGAARSGHPEAANAEIAKLDELHGKLKDSYWAGQVDIQRQVAAAWTLYAEGKRDDGLKAMSAAADAEDKTEKHPVTPGAPKPARELYGEMLLASGNSKEALVAFEATLKKEPNRLGAYVGAAKAAKKSGDKAKAREYSEKIVVNRRRRGQGPYSGCRCARVPEDALTGHGAGREGILFWRLCWALSRRRPARSRSRCSAMPAYSASGS